LLSHALCLASHKTQTGVLTITIGPSMAIYVCKKVMNINKTMGCDDTMNPLESYAAGVVV